MKKTYQKPTVEEVKVLLEQHLLAGSALDVNSGSGHTNSGTILSKRNDSWDIF